jgi:hypothetical protein
VLVFKFRNTPHVLQPAATFCKNDGRFHPSRIARRCTPFPEKWAGCGTGRAYAPRSAASDALRSGANLRGKKAFKLVRGEPVRPPSEISGHQIIVRWVVRRRQSAACNKRLHVMRCKLQRRILPYCSQVGNEQLPLLTVERVEIAPVGAIGQHDFGARSAPSDCQAASLQSQRPSDTSSRRARKTSSASPSQIRTG